MSTKHIERTAHLRWLGPIEDFRVSPVAQRQQKQWRIDELAANLDIEQLGIITVNVRKPSGDVYIIDGGHRVAALVQIGWGDQSVQCQVYEGLSESEEADMFLKINNVLAVSTYDKYRVAVTAGRDAECSVDRIVQQCGLQISKGQGDGSISCVGTLMKIYRRSGPSALAKTLKIIHDAYGKAGYSSAVVGGIGMMVARYNGDLDIERLVTKLATTSAGVNGLRGRAAVAQKQFGGTREACVAAAAVDIYNSQGGKGKRIPSWWKATD